MNSWEPKHGGNTQSGIIQSMEQIHRSQIRASFCINTNCSEFYHLSTAVKYKVLLMENIEEYTCLGFVWFVWLYDISSHFIHFSAIMSEPPNSQYHSVSHYILPTSIVTTISIRSQLILDGSKWAGRKTNALHKR